MTVTLDISPEREALLREHAQAFGNTIEEWLVKVTEQMVPPGSIAHLQRSNPKEWIRRFDEWVDSHDPNTPVLSDEAMSRESIYPDRF